MSSYPIKISRSELVPLRSLSELAVPVFARKFQWAPSQVTALLDNAASENPQNLGDVITYWSLNTAVDGIPYGTDLLIACALVDRFLIDEDAAGELNTKLADFGCTAGRLEVAQREVESRTGPV